MDINSYVIRCLALSSLKQMIKNSPPHPLKKKKKSEPTLMSGSDPVGNGCGFCTESNQTMEIL